MINLVVSRGLADDSLVRQDVARLESGVRTIAANSARALAAVLRGQDPGEVASVNRLVKSEFEPHLHALALRAVGPTRARQSGDRRCGQRTVVEDLYTQPSNSKEP